VKPSPQDLIAAADRLQKRIPWLAFPVAVWKKFSDDQAGYLAALVAYYAFIAIFPMLLVLFSVLDLVLRNNPGLRRHMIGSALSAYPVIGPQLRSSVHPLTEAGLALVIGLIGALLGARGVAGAAQNALNTVWAVPRKHWPGFPWSLMRGIGFILVVGVGQILTAYLSSLAAGLGHVVNGVALATGTAALSFVLNIGVFWLAFRLATAAEVSWADLRFGAVASAASWQVLLLLGGYIVGHALRHRSVLYGVFGVVLGLLAWLYLQAQVTLYAVEISAVRKWRLWPRALAGPPTEQDRLAHERYLRRDSLD
jgi:membrane protein